ncbi:hypothetical protein [Streptomyces griseus]|uniref:hypothetical protein n=1 Tax=Streptomyces griseus TaxID=1911 RepID=UPI000A3731BD|nr:hypothetical protein [Streptomyces fimicarius]
MGTVTSEGWINLTTGAYSAGAPPVGTMACGDSRSITTTGTFCDVAEDGAVLGLVLVEYQYAADGSISSVRLVDAVTGDTYTPTGTVTTCPAGVAHPERDMLQLCDTNDDESGTVLTVSFLRDFARDETGAVVGHSDYTLDGEPYTPSGTVGVCPAESECRNCQTFTLCDTPADATPAPVLASGTGAQTGTAANGVGWSTSSGTSSSVPDWFPLSMFPVTAGGPFVLTLDRPSAVIWSARVGTNGTAVGRLIMPPGSELVALSPLHVYDASTRTLSPVPGAGTADGNGESTFTHLGPVTSLTIESDGTTGLNISQRSVGAFLLTPATVPFLRTTCRDCTGLVLDATDTLLDGTTPYTPIGTVGVCQPQQAEPCRDTATLLLCDEASDLVWNQISVDADPDSPAGQGWLFRLSPNDAPSTIATVRVTTSTPDTGSCASNGPRWYNNGTVFVYELDEVAQTFPTLRVNVLDFDTGETLTMLEGSPGRLEGNAYTTGGGVIRSNENNATGYLLFDGPPATFSYRFNGSCTNIAFDAVSARTTQFIRRIVTDCDTDETVSVTDTDLQGQPYTPTGEVGQCETTGGGSSECATCETLTLCDVVPDESPGGPDISWEAIDLAALADGPTSGTLANGVGWTVSCGHWLGPQGHYTIYPASGGGTPACDQTWTFDQPVYARVGLRGFNVGPSECLSWSSEGEFTVEFLHPNHEVSSAPNTICGLGGAVDESLIVSSAPVSEVTLSAINNPGQGRGIGLMEVGLLNEPPAPGTAVPFLRTVCRDCSGAVTSTTDTSLAGDPYTPAGTVTTCASGGGGSTPVEPQPCRDTSSTLLCDTAATDAITVFDPANVAGSDGWEVVAFTGANAGSGPEAAMPYPAPNGAPFGYPAFGARTDQNAGTGGSWAGYDAAPVRWVLRKTFTAPEDGVAVAESVGFRGDGGARVRINGIDAGMYGQWNQPATSGTAQIPVTAGPNTVEIEVRDTSGINNVRGRLDISMPRTVQFMRRQTVDCDTGEVIATYDTTLDGEPYTVAGEVGQCAPVAECCEQAPPEQRVDVETELLCIRDEDSGDVLGQVIVERVYDDQSGDRLEQRLTDPTTGDPVELPPGAVLAKCPSPDRITRQICVVESGAAEFLTNAANATAGADTDWQWSPVLDGSWYPMYRVAPNALWTVQDTAPNQAHWVSPHASKSVCSPNVATAPNVTGTWFTRASWNLPANVSPDSIRIAASVLNADNDVVQWRLNDGAWQPVPGGTMAPPAWTITPSTVPGGRAGQNEIVVQITETQPAVTCPSPNQAGMILHVAATYDYEPRVWTQVIEDGRVYYLDETGARQDAIPDGQRVVACGGSGGECCPEEPACPVAFSTECVGAVTRTEASYDNTSLIGGVPGQCGSVQGPGGQFPCQPTTGPLMITSWVVNGEETLGEGGGRAFNGGPCGPGTAAAPGMHLNWSQALTNLDPTGAVWSVKSEPACAFFVGSTGGTQTVYGAMTVQDAAGQQWILGPAQACEEIQYTKVYTQECDGSVSVSWLDPQGVETDAPEGDLVPCGTGCGGSGGQGLDVETLTLCDVQDDATVSFLRHVTYGSGGQVVVVTDTALDGFAPYTPIGTVSVCQDDQPPGLDVELLPMCVIDNNSGGSIQRILAEVRYDTETGERAGVTYVDPQTWGPVALPGGTHIGLCPEGQDPEPAPDVEVLQLCDLVDGEDAVPFLRHLVYTAEAAAPAVLDTALDGATPYTVTGAVGTCDSPCRPHVVEACRWDDTDGDGIGDVRYVELISVDGCTGALAPVGTYLPDMTGPYEPTAPVDDGPVAGAPAARGVQAHRVLLAAGASWDAAAVPLLQSVSVVAHGTGQVTTADGPSTLTAGESIGWSVARDSDAALTGPLTVSAVDGPVAVAWTRSVDL